MCNPSSIHSTSFDLFVFGFRTLIPPFFPFPDQINLGSGIAEVLVGIVVMIPTDFCREVGGWAHVLLMILVFPANIYCALDETPRKKLNLSASDAWGRLPLQLIFIWWGYQITQWTLAETFYEVLHVVFGYH